MLTEYTMKNFKCPRKATLSVPYITPRLGTVRTVENLVDVSDTLYEHAATMFNVEETCPR